MNLLADALRPTPLRNIAFEIFGQEVRWYAIFILSGAILVALYGYYRFGKPLGVDSDLVLEGLTIGLICGVVGARIYYVIFNHKGINSLWDAINPRGGGLAIHGAFIATVTFLIIYSKIKNLNIVLLIEIVMPLFLFAQAVGRWGNFFNQEAFGPLVNGYTNNPLTTDQLIAQRATLESYWIIPKFVIDNMYITGVISGWPEGIEHIVGYYHPTFYYEFLFNLTGVLLIMLPRRFSRKLYIGDGLAIYLVWYGVTRFFIESLRTDPLLFLGLKVAQLISILFIFLGIAIFVLRRVFRYKLIPSYDMFYQKGATLWNEDPAEFARKKQERKARRKSKNEA